MSLPVALAKCHPAASTCRLVPGPQKKSVSTFSFTVGVFSDFATRAQNVALDLKTFRFMGNASSIIHEKILSLNINSVLNDSLQKTNFTPEEAQSLCVIADELKKHNRHRSVMWETLTPAQKRLVDRLAPYSEPPCDQRPDQQVPECYSYTLDFEQGVVNFGDGRLFKVRNLKDPKDGNYVFPLISHPGLSLYRTDALSVDELDKTILDETGTIFNIGRMSELFPINKIQNDIKTNWIQAHYYTDPRDKQKHRLYILYRYYVQSMLEVIGVPVNKAKAIDHKGRWEIRSQEAAAPLSGMNFVAMSEAQLDKMADDIYTFFQAERDWSLNIMGNDFYDLFAFQEGTVVLNKWPKIPTLLNENVNARHSNILKSLRYFHAIHARLIKLFETRSQTENSHSQLIKDLIERQFFDNVKIRRNFEAALAVLRLVPKINDPFLAQPYPLKTIVLGMMSEVPVNTGVKPEGFRKVAEKLAERQIEQDKVFKEQFYLHLLAYFKDFSHPKTENLIEVAAEMLQDIINWLNSHPELRMQKRKTDGYKDVGEHFMVRVGYEILQELDVLSKDESSLNAMLKHCSNHRIDIDEQLQSYLHDRVVENSKRAIVENVTA